MSIRNQGLNAYQLNNKVIIVCKKEDDNLGHLRRILFKRNPILGKRRTLIIDDEADFASISFQKRKGEGVKAGTIARLINRLRKDLQKNSSFLQVTATPYSLYLQPKGEASVQVKSSNQHDLRSRCWCLHMVSILVDTIISEIVRSREQLRGICMRRSIPRKWNVCVNRIGAVASRKRF